MPNHDVNNDEIQNPKSYGLFSFTLKAMKLELNKYLKMFQALDQKTVPNDQHSTQFYTQLVLYRLLQQSQASFPNEQAETSDKARESLFNYDCTNVRIVSDLRFGLRIYCCTKILVLDINSNIVTMAKTACYK